MRNVWVVALGVMAVVALPARGDDTADRVRKIVQAAQPSLVRVTFTVTMANPMAAFGGGGRGGRGGERGMPGGGATQQVEESVVGVILDERGHVLVPRYRPPALGNLFGAAAAPAEPELEDFTVHLADGTTARAELVGHDEATSFTVVRFDPTGLEAPPLPRSGGGVPALGDPVLCVGYLPAEFGGAIKFTLTRINAEISQPRRLLSTLDAVDDVQGGPVYDLEGHVVGIVGAYVGVQREGGGGNPFGSIMRLLQGRGSGEISARGMVIPLEELSGVLEDPGSVGGKTAGGWHGIQYVGMDADVRMIYGLADDAGGVVVLGAVAGSPAAEAGLEEGDLIVAVAGSTLPAGPQATGAFEACFQGRKPGELVTLSVLRDGSPREVPLTLGEDPGRFGDAPSHRDEALGFAVRQATPDYLTGQGLPGALAGMVVTRVDAGGAAGRGGLREGDVIVAVDGSECPTMDSFRRALSASGSGPSLTFQVHRGGGRVEVTVPRR